MPRSLEQRYFGTEMELDCLGECQLSPEASRELELIQSENGYVKYRAAMEWITKNYADDPTDPESRFANDLHALLAEQLGLENLKDLKYYSARHTPLDYYHGVDAFFIWNGITVTLDLTKNPNKKESGYKADVIILVNPEQVGEENQEQHESQLKDYAKELAAVYSEKMEEKESKTQGRRSYARSM